VSGVLSLDGRKRLAYIVVMSKQGQDAAAGRLDPLTPEQVSDRARICHEVDLQGCDACGRAFEGDVASDAAWFIDSEGHRDETGDYETAIIRCPNCW
jgi:hypothetical protein